MPDARLDLQALVTQVYDSSGFEARIDYRLEPEPPLPTADAAWARAILKAAALH